MMIIQLLLLATIITFGISTSGFGDSLRYGIWKLFLFPKHPITAIPDKPFFCPLCATFWIGLVYLYITDHFTLLYITILALISYLTDVIDTVLRLIKDILVKVVDLVYKLVDL